MKKKLRILHLLSQRPDSTGSGIYLQAMLREAQAWGHENFLVAGVQSYHPVELECIGKDQCMFLEFYKADVSYHIVGMSDVMPYESTQFCNLSPDDLHEYESSFSKILRSAVDRFNPEIIHSHHLWLFSSLARRLFSNIPIVTTCHGSDLRQFQKCSHFQERVLSGCRNLDAIMALSRVQREEILKLYGLRQEKVHVVGAGYNDGLFTFDSKPKSRPVNLVYAGKLSFAKGVPWFLRALSRIDSPEWQLHLVGGGSGKEKDECLALAKAMGKRVVIHGAVSQKDLAKIMRQAHIFVLPSFYEGLPLVVLEGLASGCRIIVTDLPGVNEIFKGVKAEFISRVKMPRLKNMDQPLFEDEKKFEQDLKGALKKQIHAAYHCPQIELSSIQDKIASFSWKGIFRKVQNIYYNAIEK